MTSFLGEVLVGRHRCMFVVVAVTLTVAWSSALQSKHRATASADDGETDLDRPAVDDPSAAVVGSTSVALVPSKYNEDAVGRQRSRPRHRQHRHRGASGPVHPEPGRIDDEITRSVATTSGDEEGDRRRAEGDHDLFAADVAGPVAVAREADGASHDGEEVLPVAPVAELEHVVVDLRAQLKESHATHMHTRSVINVLQEKQEAQERDMAILKDDLARLQRDFAAERELVKALKAQSADSAWAIADVKRGQDQAAGDLAVLKRLQEQQNETMYLVEELMMSNAVEIISHNKHAVAVRHEIAQLQTEAADDRKRIRELGDQLQQHIVQRHDSHTSSAAIAIDNRRRWGEDGNSIEDEEDEDGVIHYGLPNQLRRPDRHMVAAALSRSDDDEGGGDRMTLDLGSNHTATGSGHTASDNRRRQYRDSGERSTMESLSLIQTRLDKYDEDHTRLDARVADVNRRLSQISQPQTPSPQAPRSSPGGDTIAVGAELLQQAFVNFTRHIYGLEETWRQQTLDHNDVDLRTVAVTDEQPTSISVDRRLLALNASIADVRSATDSHRARTETTLLGVDRRLAELAAAIGERDARQRHLELLVTNRSLEQCRRSNAELVADLRAAEVVEKVAGIERLLGEQSIDNIRIENALSVANQEIRRHTDSINSLSKQTKLLRHLPADVSTVQADIGNFLAQLPADCTAAMGQPSSRRPDGVYLIRPSGDGTTTTRTARPTIRVYCQRDTVDPSTVWTVIQRRSDGRESFARGWNDYRTGFGDPSGEHWLGNDHIARLTASASLVSSSAVVDEDSRRSGAESASAAGTSTSPTWLRSTHRLRVDMWDTRGRYWIAEYPSFRVRGPDDLYRLELGDVDLEAVSLTKENPVDAGGGKFVGAGDGPNSAGLVSGGGTAKTGGFTGNATDALRYSDRQSFSAVDKDNDVSTTDCAKFYAAGWWYKHCHYANLNGRYTSGMVWFNEDIDEWLQMRQTVMRIASTSTASPTSSLNVDNHSTSSSSVYHDISSPSGGAGVIGDGGVGAASSSSASPSHRNKSKTLPRVKESSTGKSSSG